MKDVSRSSSERVSGLAAWARKTDPGISIPATAALVPVSDDASFRRYFRFSEGGSGLIFVDAPPEHEDNESFVKISAALCGAGITCPQVRGYDLELGYLAVTDLGDRLYLDEIRRDPALAPGLYEDALTAIYRLLPVRCDLPAYDATRLMTEMSLFHEWYLEGQLDLTVNSEVEQMLADTYGFLADSALEQPTGFVHRDFHSRNLMRVQDRNPGIIDFQDAVLGPVTYDLVSLYKDCYYRFDTNIVHQAVEKFRKGLVARDIIEPEAPVQRWFDLMGAQRHLKCLGIFSRLNLRDGKPGYLADIPLVLGYLVEVAGQYEELARFDQWLQAELLPKTTAPDFRATR